MSIEKKKHMIRQQLLKKQNGVKNGAYMKACHFLDDLDKANIPVSYWLLHMKNFKGPKQIKDIITTYIDSLDDNYLNGKSICLVGNQGTGKTMSGICVLKEALKKNFGAYYITAQDMMASMVRNNDMVLRKKLYNVDFLLIDEVDSRFFPSDAQKELFSAIYEGVFRHRAQNNFPTIICTNETNDILSVFYGASVLSIQSLYNQYLNVYPVSGKDYRKVIND